MAERLVALHRQHRGVGPDDRRPRAGLRLSAGGGAYRRPLRGHRPGDNLFSDSIVALDIETGERAWHFQTIHHDVWDFDLPNAPILVDITVDGREIEALAQPSKQAFLYVLDRATGEPVWPIEERPVPQSDVPGEVTAATQPFPSRPPPFDRQGIGVDDLIDFTPELRRRAEETIAPYRIGPLYTPPSVASWEGTLGTLHVPALTGGSNWPGGSFDPETGIFYIYSKTEVHALGLVSDPRRSNMDYIMGRPRPPAGQRPRGGSGFGLNVEGISIIRPPWGRITAIDLHAGEIVWQVAHGETPDHVRDHPLLAGVDVPRTGVANQRIGTLVTKTLVIAGDGGLFTGPDGARGSALRAYDKATGEEVGSVPLPVPCHRVADELQPGRRAVPGRGHRRRGVPRRAVGVQGAIAARGRVPRSFRPRRILLSGRRLARRRGSGFHLVRLVGVCSMAVTVRPLRDHEIRLYLEIHERAVRGLALSHYSQDDIEGWVVPASAENLRRLALNPDREIRLVAELDGEPVGIGALVLEESELLAVYVSPEGARRGLRVRAGARDRADRKKQQAGPPHAPRLSQRGAVLRGPRLRRSRENGSGTPQRSSHGGGTNGEGPPGVCAVERRLSRQVKPMRRQRRETESRTFGSREP